MKGTFVVTTTIRIPIFLKELCSKTGIKGRKDISFLIIGDTKTPAEAASFCKNLSKEFNIQMEYLGIGEQEKALSGYGELLRLMPLNSGSRKMIGNFLAYIRGCETAIMIDDDNYVTDKDFFRYYEVVGKRTRMKLIESGSGWYNVYESLVVKDSIPIYPRGYPWSERHLKIPSAVKTHVESRKVIAKNGFVLGDPDIDAIARLFHPIQVVSMRRAFEPHFGLYPGTSTSFNNQNTALSREAVAVYFTPPSTGRNADIWTSFLICRLAAHMGDIVAFGNPLVRQDRNPHDLWKDLADEIVNDRAADRFVKMLAAAKLTKKTYLGSLGELIEKCQRSLEKIEDMPPDEIDMMKEFFAEYNRWHELLSGVSSKER